MEIEQRGNYLEMEDVLMSNLFILETDADFAIWCLKCIASGGMKKGENVRVKAILNSCKQNDRQGNLFDRLINKKGNEMISAGSKSLIVLTNSFFIASLRTVIKYGNNQLLGVTSKIITPFYASIEPMLNNRAFMTSRLYEVVAALMCSIGNQIVDDIVRTNKTNFPASKDIIGGFVESVMCPLNDCKKGILGKLIVSSVPREVLTQVDDTYNKIMLDMR